MDTFKHKEYLTKKQLAEKLGVTEVSIDNWRRNGSLPYIKMGQQTNSRVLFDWDDVCHMMERRQIETTVPMRHQVVVKYFPCLREKK